MLFGGKTPLDLNKNFSDGRRLLGAGKTIKGTYCAIIIGIITTLVLWLLFTETTLILSSNYLAFGFLLSIGAIVGDLIGSFLKRRKNIQRGEAVLLLDQLDFIIVGVIFGGIIHWITIWELIFIIILTLALHKLTNWIAFKWRIKKVPW